MRVLSLFDGMACAMLAMQKADIPVSRYIAYEIDKYAVQTSTHNFPMIEHKGDVFTADFTEYEGFDFLMGGSPCTYWSIAQKNNRETEASGMGWELFSQYVRALKEAKPKYFVYENNKSMSKAIRESISSAFGFEPICINSALVSAQNRQRLYWCGIRQPDGTYKKADIPQPEDRGILLKDILESGIAWKEKQNTIDANYYKGGNLSSPQKQSDQRNCVAEPVKQLSEKEIDYMFRKEGRTDYGYVQNTNRDKAQCITANIHKGVPYNCLFEEIIDAVCVAERGRYNEDGVIEQRFEAREDGKTNVLTTVRKDNNVAEPIRVGALPRPNGELSTSQAFRIYDVNGKSININAGGGGAGGKTGLYAVPEPVNTTDDGKSQTIKAPSEQFSGSGKDRDAMKRVYEVKDGLITIKGKQYPIKLADGYYIIRKLTVRECMRLQTVPEWYEFPVSNSQAYKMLGNGWTVSVIAHLLTYTMKGNE